ncbi:MAG: mannonate dehydratase [Brevinema sp.]
MKMSFRWFGENNDSVSLEQIRQIPQTNNIVWSLHHKIAGDVWTREEIQKEANFIKSYGFEIDVVESVNIHEDIKLGIPSRNKYIEIYQDTIKKLSEVGVKVICYNFMPVFDWMRSDLAMCLTDGSKVLAYDAAIIESRTFEQTLKAFSEGSLGYTLPGWEPERLALLSQILEAYQGVSEEQLWLNLEYFLKAIIPFAKECGIKMAIHPDDPPWSIFGLPRIVNRVEHLRKILSLVDDPHNGLTFCTGSLGSTEINDLPVMLEEFLDRSPFMHIRNVKRESTLFYETSHRTQDGSVDITSIVEILQKNNYQGYVRPDHGRMLWNEEARPGYGLYDRALGIMYLWGLWDAFSQKD